MIFNVQKDEYQYQGSSGLPDHYPRPPQTDKLLFYIQRNHNFNTVIYEANFLSNGTYIDKDHPMHAYWIKYTAGGEIEDLNYYQNKMAYGYTSQPINSDTFSFNFVSYEDLKLYIARNKKGHFQAFCHINQEMSVLKNIYVYAEALGVFPNVKFIELFGTQLETDLKVYQRINIDS